MNDFETELTNLVQRFVSQVGELARRAAVDSLQQVLGGQTAPAAGPMRGAKPSIRRRGGRRSSDELNALQDAFLKHVKAHPGQRIEEINKALGTSTKDLALRIRKLVADGAVKTKGERRGTQYLPKN